MNLFIYICLFNISFTVHYLYTSMVILMFLNSFLIFFPMIWLTFQTGDVVGAVDSLSALEKLTRLGVDMRSNTRIVEYMVKLCFEGANWTFLNDTITVLSKKRSIIKMAIAKMVDIFSIQNILQLTFPIFSFI